MAKKNWFYEMHFRRSLIARDIADAAKLMKTRQATESEEGFMAYDRPVTGAVSTLEALYEAQVLNWKRVGEALRATTEEMKTTSNSDRECDLRNIESTLLRIKTSLEVDAEELKSRYESFLIQMGQEGRNQ
jgi:hypothetical protein